MTSKTDPITLYFHPHHLDSQKVLFALFENEVEFKSEEVNYFKGETFTASFLELNPGGELPVLKVTETEVYTKCEDILEYITGLGNRSKGKKGLVGEDRRFYATEKYLTSLLRRLDMHALTLGCLTYFDELGLKPEEPYLSQRFRDRMKEMMKTKLTFVKSRIELFPLYREPLKMLAKALEDSMILVESKKRFNGLLTKLISIFAICENELKARPEDPWLFTKIEAQDADIHFGFLLHHLFEMGLGSTSLWKSHPNVVQFYQRFQALPNFQRVMKMVDGDDNEVSFNEGKVYTFGIAIFSLVLGFATIID